MPIPPEPDATPDPPGAAALRHALVVEDDDDIRSLLSTVLRQAGFEVEEAALGADALHSARRHPPDLVTLDLHLPDMDGLEVCRELRSFSDAYVVIVSARREELDRLLGLEIGADDYLTKPFSPRELRARVAAMFRRPRSSQPGASPPAPAAAALLATDSGAPPLSVGGDLEIDLEAREVRRAGQLVELTKIEFELLAALASSPRRVFERATLLRMVWQEEWFGDEHVVDVHLANLRRKLGDGAKLGRYVKTVRGVGYRLGDGPGSGPAESL